MYSKTLEMSTSKFRLQKNLFLIQNHGNLLQEKQKTALTILLINNHYISMRLFRKRIFKKIKCYLIDLKLIHSWGLTFQIITLYKQIRMRWILNKERIPECHPITTKPNKIKDKANSLTGQTNRTFQISKQLKQENKIK
jgi:hypothetical protein